MPGLTVAITGATGMIGAGVLAECLSDRRIDTVIAIGRTPLGHSHSKVREHLQHDFLHWPGPTSVFQHVDAVFFCLGVSAIGLNEAEYHRITYDYTLATARAAAAARPRGTLCYVSGQGTDATESGRQMWARVKGKTENALFALAGVNAYAFRAGYVQPGKGVRSKTRWYRMVYAVMGPLYPLLRRVAPRYVTSTAAVGRAMITVAAHGSEHRTIENADINALADPRAPES
ncbi:MAG: NAD-dependent epimerase/dehydratase family protein [Gemmatimonadales bacterium]